MYIYILCIYIYIVYIYIYSIYIYTHYGYIHILCIYIYIVFKYVFVICEDWETARSNDGWNIEWSEYRTVGMLGSSRGHLFTAPRAMGKMGSKEPWKLPTIFQDVTSFQNGVFFFKQLSWFYWEDHLNRQIFRWESWAQRAVWDSLVASNGFDGNIHPTQWDVATFPWENPWENPWEKSTPFFLELPMAKNHRTYRPFQGGRIYGVWEWCSMRLGWGSLQIQSAVDVYGCLWFMLVGFEIVGW